MATAKKIDRIQNMKKLIYLILLLSISCIGPEYMGPPQSSAEAQKNGVLIDRYIPNQKRVMINEEIYLIEDAWTSYNLPERNSKKINRLAYEFLIVLRKEKTGEISTDYNFNLPLGYVKYNGKKYGFSKGVGDSSGMLAVDFISEKKGNAGDTLSLTFINIKNQKTIRFIKKKQPLTAIFRNCAFCGKFTFTFSKIFYF